MSQHFTFAEVRPGRKLNIHPHPDAHSAPKQEKNIILVYNTMHKYKI
jgi:hypothetical protein